MTARSLWARLAVSLAAIATLGLASARADVLHATYRVSLIGLPIVHIFDLALEIARPAVKRSLPPDQGRLW